MHEIIILHNDGGQRLDKFLAKALPNLPPSLVYKSIRTKKIKVNRKRAQGGQMLCEGDTVQLFLADEFFSGKNTENRPCEETLSRMRVGLCVLYEDENILLLYKHAGISVHEDNDGGNRNLLTQLQAYLYQKGEYRPSEEQSFAPALCNRIDRNTEGIVIAAKNAEALREMDSKIRAHEIEKYYLCAVHGCPKPTEAVMEAWLVKHENESKVTVFDKNPPPSAKKIITGYKVLQTKGDLSLLEVRLYTGRTHQIRAHMAHLGHPLLGDGKYGVNRLDRTRGYDTQALCSYKLRFAFTTGTPSVLDYLNEKCVTVDTEAIGFLREFDPLLL